MAGGIPSEAVGVSVGVLLYSVISLFLCTMLVGLLITYGEKLSYVTIHSSFTSLSTLASIIQQIHFAIRWEVIKQAQFDKAIRALTLPGLTFVGGAHIVDKSLFFIQFWCYNIMALNIFFWSIDLFTGAWGFRTPWLGDWLPRIGPISKVFSVIFPALIIGFMQAEFVLKSGIATFLVSNGTMFLTLSTGSILLILILYKYMKTRRLATGGSRRGGWWASRDSKSQQSRDVGSHYTVGTANLSTRSSIYDRALVTRFSIGFVILAFFLAAIIIFSYVSSTTNTAVVAAGKPDRSTKSAIIDILLFMPGVTASLVTFLVFGTAKSWRQYRDLLVGGCGIRNKIVQRKFLRQRDGRGNGGSNEEGLEFAPLPRLETTPSLQERIKREEATKRVQMFAREVRREIGLTERPDTAVAGLTSDAQTPGTYTRGAPSPDLAIDADLDLRKSYHQRRYSNPFPAVGGTSGGKNLQFHRPRPSIDTAGIGSTRAPVSSYGVIDVGFGRREDDQVVRPEWEGTRDERRDSYRSPLRMNYVDKTFLVTDTSSDNQRGDKRDTH